MQPLILLLIVAVICLCVCYIGLAFVRDARKELTDLKKSISSNPSETALLELLQRAGVPYIDNRAKGGAFWIIGGKELNGIVAQARALGIEFHFKPGGGKRTTKGKNSWWAKF